MKRKLLKNQNTGDLGTTKQIVKQDKIEVKLIKKIMSENKTTLLFLRNQDWKKSRYKSKKEINCSQISHRASSLN